MALLKSKKKEIIEDLNKNLKNSVSAVFVNFHGLNVENETKLRRELDKNDVSYKVVRKTLIRRASEGVAEGSVPELEGEVAVAYSREDQTAPAREVHNFSKEHGNVLSILGGIFDGKFIGKESMQEIAMIPSREVLYAKIVNLLNSPIQRFVIGLDQIAKLKN